MLLVHALAAILTIALVSLPGWLLAARARLPLGPFLAAGFASTLAVLTVTALLSEITGYLPAWSTLVVAAGAGLAVWWRTRGQPLALPDCHPLVLLLPAAMALHAWLAYHVGFRIGEHPAVFHAWYNADWFKHLGHTNALANLGLPAQDIFGGGERLNYYWLFYMLPAVAGSLIGDPGMALAATNITLVFLFWLLLAGFLRELGLSQGQACLVSVLGWTIFTMEGTFRLLARPPDIWDLATREQMGSGLLTALNTFIPQHLLMTAGLLSFGLLWTRAPQSLRWPAALALAPVIAAGAVSTLLGASTVMIAGCLILLDGRYPPLRRLLIAGAVGLLSLALIFALHVIDLSFGGDALSSPAFETFIDQRPYGERATGALIRQIGLFGLALPLGLWGLLRGWRRDGAEGRPLILFAMLMALVGTGVIVGSDIALDGKRLVQELSFRNGYAISLAYLAGIAILVRDLPVMGRDRFSTIALIALTTAIAIPSNVLNFIWQGWSQPFWQVVVPDADMRALAYLERESAKDALVLQYPEAPYVVEEQRDTWVPIFAGRRIPGSYRSTRWSDGKPQVEAAQRFFAGEPVAVPGGVDWIYLSRTLHPKSYDRLVARLRADGDWQVRYCEADACLFSLATGRRKA